eukprot:scaffold18554_cov105-Skeletonema_marinoi.AAC.2
MGVHLEYMGVLGVHWSTWEYIMGVHWSAKTKYGVQTTQKPKTFVSHVDSALLAMTQSRTICIIITGAHMEHSRSIISFAASSSTATTTI